MKEEREKEGRQEKKLKIHFRTIGEI